MEQAREQLLVMKWIKKTADIKNNKAEQKRSSKKSYAFFLPESGPYKKFSAREAKKLARHIMKPGHKCKIEKLNRRFYVLKKKIKRQLQN